MLRNSFMRTALVLAALVLPALAWADASETAKQLDALYAQRQDSEKLKELEKATEEALKAYPEDYGVLWRAARYHYWVSDGLANKESKKRIGKLSWDLGERAVKANKDGIEGHYYAAIGMGQYSQAIGILNALTEGIEGKFNARLDKAVSMDGGYSSAGPLIAKGRYFHLLPWPKRDLDKAAQHFEKAIKEKPEALRAYLYLAETQLADGEPKKAKETLAKVFEGSEAYDVAEARRVKTWAKKVQAEIEEELK